MCQTQCHIMQQETKELHCCRDIPDRQTLRRNGGIVSRLLWIADALTVVEISAELR